MGRTILTETLRHREAFDFYYQLGATRSLDRVSRKFNVSGTSVNKWAKSFKWHEKVHELDEQVKAKMGAAVVATIVDQKTKLANIVQLLIDDCIFQLPDGHMILKFRVESVQDFERVTKLYQLLVGEPTDRGELNVNVSGAKDTLVSRLSRLASATGNPLSN